MQPEKGQLASALDQIRAQLRCNLSLSQASDKDFARAHASPALLAILLCDLGGGLDLCEPPSAEWSLLSGLTLSASPLRLSDLSLGSNLIPFLPSYRGGACGPLPQVQPPRRSLEFPCRPSQCTGCTQCGLQP